MTRRNGNDVVSQLITAYEAEALLYERVQKAAAEQHAVLMNGRDPVSLSELVERQRILAEDIGRIEEEIAPLRQYWEQMRDRLHDSHLRVRASVLDDLLEQIAVRIHYIIQIERENSRALLSNTTEGQ